MQVLTARSNEVYSRHLEFVRVCHEVNLLSSVKTGEQEGVDRLLREVGIREVLRPWHEVDIDIINEGFNPFLEAIVSVTNVLVDAMNDYRLDHSTRLTLS